jgi:hypothetical protein
MTDRPSGVPRVIRASELAQHRYCARAWWLEAVKGVPPSNTRELEQGEAAHRRHGRKVRLAGALRWAAAALIVLAAALALLALAG